jgi:hypothetical protein
MNKYISLKRYTLSNIDEIIKECEKQIKYYLENAFTDIYYARMAGEELIRLADLKECKTLMKRNVSYSEYEKLNKPTSFEKFIGR